LLGLRRTRRTRDDSNGSSLPSKSAP
jgi:hypothetical protein